MCNTLHMSVDTIAANGQPKQRLTPTTIALLAERKGNLPIWIRAPKFGPEFYTGLTRPKLYDLAARGLIRTCSLREPHQVQGTRLFNLQSVLDYIESKASKTEAPSA